MVSAGGGAVGENCRRRLARLQRAGQVPRVARIASSVTPVSPVTQVALASVMVVMAELAASRAIGASVVVPRVAQRNRVARGLPPTIVHGAQTDDQVAHVPGVVPWLASRSPTYDSVPEAGPFALYAVTAACTAAAKFAWSALVVVPSVRARNGPSPSRPPPGATCRPGRRVARRCFLR